MVALVADKLQLKSKMNLPGNHMEGCADAAILVLCNTWVKSRPEQNLLLCLVTSTVSNLVNIAEAF